MRLLVSNDDGIAAPSLAVLVRALVAAGHEVTVAAPSAERSGSSLSLGVVTDQALVAIDEDVARFDGVARAVSVDAPPAVAVRAACMGCFGPAPELVVAGINPGFNTGRVVLHSGTVGATLSAVALGRPGIAVSADHESVHGFETAARVAVAAVAAVSGGEDTIALNLNVPDRELADLAGVEEATLSRESLVDISLSRESNGLRVQRVRHPPPYAPGCDADLITRGYVAVTAISGPWGLAPDVGPVIERIRAGLGAHPSA